MKKILLFGAGKSATVLIEFLAQTVARENWQLTVADADLELVKSKLENTANTKAAWFDINNDTERKNNIADADIVISLLPPALHILVAKDCVQLKKNLLTASYVDEQMKALEKDIQNNDLLFICELGLDPGIDHMSAKKMIDEIEVQGGKITSFISHCGGLVAPESDDNPWHYKISWNPRNVVLAGKAGAVYLQNGQQVQQTYADLFREKRFTDIKNHEALCWYPNRDSTSYIDVYGLHDCSTFIRTTLRHPDFMYGWKNIIDLKLTDETPAYQTDGKSLKDFFKEHMDRNNFSNWLEEKLQSQFDATKNILAELVNLTEMEKKAAKKGVEPIDEFMMVTAEGDLEEIDIEELKLHAAAALADKMHDAKLTLKQLFYLGLGDEATIINKGFCSAADVLQFALENKLALLPADKDIVVMKHEIEYLLAGKNYKQTATLVAKGKDNRHTAMAKTVGLPLGIAAELILKNQINIKGLHIPIVKEIYEPVLQQLHVQGISFIEEKI